MVRRSTRGTAEPKQPGARRHTRTNLIPGRPCKRKLSFSFSRQTNTRYDLWNKAGKALPGVPLSRCRISAPKEKAPAIVALAGAKSQMQALHSERPYFRRIALRESIDVAVMDNSNVNGVVKMTQPPLNRRLPTDVKSADRASVIHPV